MKAPEKIYLCPSELAGIDYEEEWLDRPFGDSIEYVRIDAFIEAVADWMSDNLQTVSEVDIPSAHHVESIPELGIITQTEFIEKFKKEIMFLLD